MLFNKYSDRGNHSSEITKCQFRDAPLLLLITGDIGRRILRSICTNAFRYLKKVLLLFPSEDEHAPRYEKDDNVRIKHGKQCSGHHEHRAEALQRYA